MRNMMATKKQFQQQALEVKSPELSYVVKQILALSKMRRELHNLTMLIRNVELDLCGRFSKCAVTEGNTTYIVECLGTANCPVVKIEEVANAGVV
jgi:hypothetical protein